MKMLEWMSSFDTGVEAIDKDHRELFDIVVRIQGTIGRNDLEACRELVGVFLETTERHFESEEAFLSRVGYDDLDAHKEYHERLLSKGRALLENYEKGMERGQMIECYMDIVGLLIDDVVRGDVAFKSFMQERGISSSPARGPRGGP